MAEKSSFSFDSQPLSMALIVAAILFSGAFYFAPGKTIMQSSADIQHTISVSSDSSQEVVPDKVEIIFSVVSRGTDPSALQADNDAKLRQVQTRLIALGVPEANIKTVGYSLNRWSEYNKTLETYVDMGYELTNTLRVVSYDISKAGKIVGGAVQNGANEVQGIQFGLSDAAQKEIYGQLLQKASSQAKDKAASMASAAGVKIVSLGQMSEGYSQYEPMANFAFSGAGKMSADAAEVSVSAGLLRVRASVNAIYNVG